MLDYMPYRFLADGSVFFDSKDGKQTLKLIKKEQLKTTLEIRDENKKPLKTINLNHSWFRNVYNVTLLPHKPYSTKFRCSWSAVFCDYTIIIGNHNFVSGSKCIICGNFNIIMGDECYVHGKENYVTGDNNNMLGIYNLSRGDNNKDVFIDKRTQTSNIDYPSLLDSLIKKRKVNEFLFNGKEEESLKKKPKAEKNLGSLLGKRSANKNFLGEKEEEPLKKKWKPEEIEEGYIADEEEGTSSVNYSCPPSFVLNPLDDFNLDAL
jgi:hypothetical protein